MRKNPELGNALHVHEKGETSSKGMNNLIKLHRIIGGFLGGGVTWTQTGVDVVYLNPTKIINVEEVKKGNRNLLGGREVFTVINFTYAMVSSYSVTESPEEVYRLANSK